MHQNQLIDRVNLACLQCRSRRVKCDGTQPLCGRCRRDGKECTYQASRRGGLDKAALAKRRMRLRQEAEAAQQSQANQSASTEYDHQVPTTPNKLAKSAEKSQVTLQVSENRLLELYYDNFWHPFPFPVPRSALQARLTNSAKHGMTAVAAVMHWIGSVYAPWITSEPYHHTAVLTLRQLENTPFNVQALMLLSLAQHNSDMRPEGRKTLDLAVDMALQLRMNERDFARAYGEGDPVLEESWRRTYYFLYYFDQQFAIVAKGLGFALASVPIYVDLPCDDAEYESGQIPTPATLQQYNEREFEDIETVFSSITYLHDLATVLTTIMKLVLESGAFTENLTNLIDARIASWMSLLPACKKDPLRMDGTVDEVIWQAHLSSAILMTVHRPYSALVYSMEEFTTESFMVLSPMVAPNISRRAAHTARALKGLEACTKLLAIPSPPEKHGLFSFSIAAQMATAQVSACKNLLEDHALSIGRDRLRLSIGYLNTMGAFWPLAKKMAKEVKSIARNSLASVQDTVQMSAAAEIEIPRDELMWPIGPSPQIDIYAGTVLPIDWNMVTSGYASSSSSMYTSSDPSPYDPSAPWSRQQTRLAGNE